jgi:hypothetical protein
MVSYAVIGRAIRVLSSNSGGARRSVGSATVGSGGKGSLERLGRLGRLGSKRKGGGDPMGGVSVRGEGRPRVQIEVLVVQTACVVQAVDQASGGQAVVVDVEKIHAQASDRQARRGDKGAAASRPRIGENATLGAVNGCAWNIIMGYICTTLHRVTCK